VARRRREILRKVGIGGKMASRKGDGVKGSGDSRVCFARGLADHLIA
jgi:hypothetical protein